MEPTSLEDQTKVLVYYYYNNNNNKIIIIINFIYIASISLTVLGALQKMY